MRKLSKRKIPSWSILTLAIGMLSVSSFASVISDIEGNGTIGTATDINSFFSIGANPDIQDAEILPWVSIESGAESAARYDYYSFSATAGSTGIFDIDYGRDSGGSFDAELNLFMSDGTFLLNNDDSLTSNGAGGSTHTFDSFISYSFTANDTYVIGVCQFSCGGADGGMIGSLIPANGTYTLQVSVENHDFSSITVPEPAIYSMLALGLTGLMFAGRRRKIK